MTDSILRVQTPEGIEYALYPAGLPMRLCAWIIDSAIQGILILAMIISAGILSEVLGLWFLLIMIFVIDWFYHFAFEVFCRGQSPGKRLMGVRVVRSDGSPVNPGASFMRNLLRFADTFMFLYLIAFVCMLVSPAFRRFGDWAADTLVVYTDSARSQGRFVSPLLRRSAMPWLDDVPPVPPPRRLDYEERQSILMFARRYPLLGRARADEIAQVWAAKLRGGPLSAESAVSTESAVSQESTASAETPALTEETVLSEATASASAYLLGIARALGG